jgi:hypothetical protein
MFIWHENLKKIPAPIPRKNYLLNPHFYPHLERTHLEQWYYTSDLSELHHTLSLTNSSLLTADTILWCTKIPVPNW